MNCIAVNTTDSSLSVALIKGDEIFCDSKNIGKSGHSSALMPAVDGILVKHNVDVGELDAIGVVVGPGSFTGIRIGVSAMTAVAFATGAKRIAITAFELIAYNRESVLAGVDAGHGNLYVATCKNGKVEDMRFVEAKDADTLKGVVFEPLQDSAKTLALVLRDKVERGEFVDVFVPFYMRKSQAEREKDEV